MCVQTLIRIGMFTWLCRAMWYVFNYFIVSRYIESGVENLKAYCDTFLLVYTTIFCSCLYSRYIVVYQRWFITHKLLGWCCVSSSISVSIYHRKLTESTLNVGNDDTFQAANVDASHICVVNWKIYHIIALTEVHIIQYSILEFEQWKSEVKYHKRYTYLTQFLMMI